MLLMEKTRTTSLPMFLKDAIMVSLVMSGPSLCRGSVDSQMLCSGRSTQTLLEKQLKEHHFVLICVQRIITFCRCFSHSNIGVSLSIIFYLHGFCLIVFLLMYCSQILCIRVQCFKTILFFINNIIHRLRLAMLVDNNPFNIFVQKLNAHIDIVQKMKIRGQRHWWPFYNVRMPR